MDSTQKLIVEHPYLLKPIEGIPLVPRHDWQREYQHSNRRLWYEPFDLHLPGDLHITAFGIDWRIGWGSTPDILLEISGTRLPKMTFEQRGQCFFGRTSWESDLFLSTHYWHDGSDNNAGGFSGAAIELEMRDGSKRIIKGPWHGCEIDCYLREDFPPTTDVITFCTDWSKLTGISSAISIPLLRQLLKPFPDVHLVFNGISIALSLQPDSLTKPFIFDWKYLRQGHSLWPHKDKLLPIYVDQDAIAREFSVPLRNARRGFQAVPAQ